MGAAKKKEVVPQVIITWMTGTDSDMVNVLSWGRGSARVYDKDQLDGRLTRTGPVPYFDDPTLAFKHMRDNPGVSGSVQLEVSAAKRLGVL